MARSRNIKPGFFLNDLLAEVEPLGRLLFAGLWGIADREGRLEDRPKKIKAEILPYDDCDPDKLLDALVEKGFIQRYEREGEKYIWIINFLKHQNPHRREVASIIPPAFQEEEEPGLALASPSPEKAESSPADSLKLIPDPLNRIPDSPDPAPDSAARASTMPMMPTKATTMATAIPIGARTAIGTSTEIVETIENEFGRVLSPIELEQVKEWEEKHSPDLIREALKITVLKGISSLRYMDAILLTWEGAHLKTHQEVADFESRHQLRGRSKMPQGKASPGWKMNGVRGGQARLAGAEINLEGLYEL